MRMARQERDAACKAGSCDVVVNSLLQTRLQAAAFCILSLLVCCLVLYSAAVAVAAHPSVHKRSRAARTELNAFTPQAFFRNSSASACVVRPSQGSQALRAACGLGFHSPCPFALVGSAPPAQCSCAERAVCSASLRARAQL